MKKSAIVSLGMFCLFTGKTLYAQSSNITASAAPTAAGNVSGGGNTNPDSYRDGADDKTAQSSDGLKFSLTPNPATNEVTCNYESADAQNTSMLITDATGANVMKMVLGAKQKGSMSLTLGNLVRGTYRVELVCGDKKATQQLVKE